MALDESAVSELLAAFNVGEGTDLVRELARGLRVEPGTLVDGIEPPEA